MKHIVKWSGAIGLSLLTHAGGAKLLEPSKDEFLMAGGAATEVALLGNAFEETLQAGDLSDVVEPTEDTPEEVQPSEVQPTEAVADEIPPATPESVSEQPSDIAPAEADVILPADEMPVTEVAQAPVTATVAPVETVVPEEKPRPEKTEKKVEKPELKKEPAKKKKVVRKKAGERGEQANSQAKGQADGVENASATAATGARRSSIAREAGNAAVDNYKGKVQGKLTRAMRYPAEAKRQGLRGVAQVSFTVTSDGGLAGVSLARSAGSPILDQAALDIVRRAAPFPAIPAEARRNTWQFTVPIEFKR
ncbi:energy transducer TonB [Sinorhizobium glycinis]|uniref:Energy transducer TonB n=1 Tax=Sinorhizobium glycinis TaxID=1472378 RepID=A0A178Y6T8_9HYPH|nr:energy transducer TonB [Sinorhizobium glycinis]OAP43299.1 energy transducer TonB [Sinorhizobium glycinis]